MTRTTRIAIILFGICAAALIIFGVLAVPRSAHDHPNDNSGDGSTLGFAPNPGARLPLASSLVDESGRPVALGEFFGKSPVVLVLEYLRCTSLCGVTLRNLADVLHELPLEPGRDYHVVGLSIDPRDKPADALAASKKYAGLIGRSGARDGTHFLTSTSPTSVQEIADTIGFHYRYDSLLDAYIHPAGFIIAAPDGVISRYVEGVAISARELTAAIADAQADKSQGPLARLLLLCHPQGVLGRFTGPVLMVFTLVEIAAALTVFAVFAAIRRHAEG